MAKHYLKTYRYIRMMFLHFFDTQILLFTQNVLSGGTCHFFMLKAFNLFIPARTSTSRGHGGSCDLSKPLSSGQGLFKPSFNLFFDFVLSRSPAKKNYVMITVRKKRADQNQLYSFNLELCFIWAIP